jgi:hypothetical protein
MSAGQTIAGAGTRGWEQAAAIMGRFFVVKTEDLK